VNDYKHDIESQEVDIDEQGLNLGKATSDREVKRLFLLARHSKEGAVVEIGSWRGRSTAYLAKAAEAAGIGNKVYGIDSHFEGSEQIFRDNMEKAGLNHIVVPIVMRSEDAIKQWSDPISLLFIDGGHDYESVWRDFTLYEPWVIDGGVIAFHDRFAEGPCRVIRDYVLKTGSFGNIVAVDGILFAIKGARDTWRGKLAKMWLLLLSYVAIALAICTRSRRFYRLQRFLGSVGRRLSERV